LKESQLKDAIEIVVYLTIHGDQANERRNNTYKCSWLFFSSFANLTGITTTEGNFTMKW